MWRGHNDALPVQLSLEDLEWMSDRIAQQHAQDGQEPLFVIKEQRHGDLFYIPTGLPHSVANGRGLSSVKLAFDFINPQDNAMMLRNAVFQKLYISPIMGQGQAEDYSANDEAIHSKVGNEVFKQCMNHNATRRSAGAARAGEPSGAAV